MKRLIISLVLLISLILESNEVTPDKLIRAIDSFKKNPELHPVHKIDLIIFKNIIVNERDNEEFFSPLEEFIYSDNLLKLSDTPSLLVEKDSITKGLTPGNQVIKSVDINHKEDLILDSNSQERPIAQLDDKPLNPSYTYFEKVDSKESEIDILVKRLVNRKEYEVIFSGSWYQPIFKKELSSPVYIKSTDKNDGIRGELTIYKERFLHSIIRVRLTKKTDKYSENVEVNTNDFNELLKFSKLSNKFFSFFKNIGKESSSLTNWIFRTKDFSQVNIIANQSLDSTEIYEDKFELNKSLKMKENEFYFIDHPHFGIILRVSLWKSTND